MFLPPQSSVLRIAGKKADLKLWFQEAVASGIEIISDLKMKQLHYQMEGLHPESQW